MLHQKSKRQGKKDEHALANMHAQLVHTHTHFALTHNHMLHFTLQLPLPLHISHSPAKTSTARETCLETEGKLPPCPDWLSSLATAYV